jgi:hypothetical protein
LTDERYANKIRKIGPVFILKSEDDKFDPENRGVVFDFIDKLEINTIKYNLSIMN